MSVQSILADARTAGRTTLLEPEAKAVLRAYGVSVPRAVVVADSDEGLDAVAELCAPLALKVISSDVLHKSDVGAVRVGIAGIAGVRVARAEMRARLASMGLKVDGFLVEEMAPQGHEISVGGMLHPQFGPVLMVGLGGILIEILNDVAFRLCPISRQDALSMLSELRGRSILEGVRGGLAADKDALVVALLRIGGEGGLLSELAGEIAELDVNPLIVGSTGACAVDARVILTQRTP